MTRSIFFVTTPELQINDRCSFAFLMLMEREKEPVLYREMSNHFGAWGQVHVKAKEANHLNPWAWAAAQRGEDHEQIVGDDGIPRIYVNVWENGRNVLSAGWDLTDLPKAVLEGTPLLVDNDLFRKLVKELPERCSLLIPHNLFQRFEAACQAEGVAVHVYHHPDPIATS